MAFLCNGMFVPPPVYAKCLSKNLARMHARVAAEKLLVNARQPPRGTFIGAFLGPGWELNLARRVACTSAK